jgi:hypothetical protein
MWTTWKGQESPKKKKKRQSTAIAEETLFHMFQSIAKVKWRPQIFHARVGGKGDGYSV